MQLSKEVRLTVDGVRRAAEAALAALDRFETENNIINALEAGTAIAQIGNTVQLMNAVLEAEALASLERIQRQIDRAGDAGETVVPFPGRVN